MTRQADKYHLSLAGEYYVAAELQRRGLHASVTYGNAKQTDVVAFDESSSRAVVIEVKTTAQNSWVVGGQVPAPADKPWVFVHLPVDAAQPPSYFVLTQSELHGILAPLDQQYLVGFRAKHGRDFDGAGVTKLSRKDAEPYQGTWDKIISLVQRVA